MSSAKSGKYFKKSSDIMEKEIVTEREHELRLQMELAEQELKVQFRILYFKTKLANWDSLLKYLSGFIIIKIDKCWHGCDFCDHGFELMAT